MKKAFMTLWGTLFFLLINMPPLVAHDADELYSSFQNPPQEYSAVPLWWWDGDTLDKERITWQLENLLEGGISSLCFIQKYPYGPPMGPQVSYFSEEWWEYMTYTARECERLGMKLWVHDESYCRPQKSFWQGHIESMVDEHPELRGNVVGYVKQEVETSSQITLGWPADMTVLLAAAYPRNEEGSIDLKKKIDLFDKIQDHSLQWETPQGHWFVTAIGYRPRGLNRTSGDVIDTFLKLHYQEYKERFGDLFEKVYAGTFQDELYILRGTPPCGPKVIEVFKDQKGYDPVPWLPALYQDIGDETDRIRCDYYDVVTQLLEEHWFKPLYEWHENHGIQFSHDNWGRNSLAGQTTQYGDYYRTMRWYQVPGYDDGGAYEGLGTRNFFDAKLAASIAACYQRPRVWCEAFHTTGWGLTPELQLAMAMENYCYGANLYDKHGLYYSTLGGWYEHAPPDVHFRQPYWKHAQALYEPITRLSYLMSQGKPVADVAILYPVTSMHAQWRAVGGITKVGKEIDQRTRALSRALYHAGLDVIFVDDETLSQAHIENGDLILAGMPFKALVMGPNTTIKRDTIRTAQRFVEHGGVVAGLGRLPSSSAEEGRNDPVILQAIHDIFQCEANTKQDSVHRNTNGGVGIFVSKEQDQLIRKIKETIEQDVIPSSQQILFHTHRRTENEDIYLLLNTTDTFQSFSIQFRVEGEPYLWDARTGKAEKIHVYKYEKPYTKISLDFAARQHHLIVFKPKNRELHLRKTSLSKIDSITYQEDSLQLTGWVDQSGKNNASALMHGKNYTGEVLVDEFKQSLDLDNDWTFTLQPTMDNQWGDFRYPPEDEFLPLDIRRFFYRQEEKDQNGLLEEWYHQNPKTSAWDECDIHYGAAMWVSDNPSSMENPPTPPNAQDQTGWSPYRFSYRYGKPATHPDDHGFNALVSDHYLTTPEGEGVYHFWTTLMSEETGEVSCSYGKDIQQIWIDQEALLDETPSSAGIISCHVNQGETPVLIAQTAGTNSYVGFEPGEAQAGKENMDHIPRLRWFHNEHALRYNPKPWEEKPVGWYQCQLPVGTSAIRIPFGTNARIWIAGEEHEIQEEGVTFEEPLPQPQWACIRLLQKAGESGGLAWKEPCILETKPVTVDTGDWRAFGLRGYSGLGIYQKEVELDSLPANARIILDLGEVYSTASVHVNEKPIATRVSRPFHYDISSAIKPGKNQITIEVANTMANYWSHETPTRYVFEGQKKSGLYGPVRLRIEPYVELSLNE